MADKTAELDMVVVQSKAKEVLKAKSAAKGAELRLSGEFLDAVNAEVHAMFDRAIKRCIDNGRQTLKPSDL